MTPEICKHPFILQERIVVRNNYYLKTFSSWDCHSVDCATPLGLYMKVFIFPGVTHLTKLALRVDIITTEAITTYLYNKT